MKKRNLSWIFIVIAVLVIVAIFVLVSKLGNNPNPSGINSGTECVLYSDCVIVGQEGDCGCGCYGKDNVPISTETGCFCAVPTSCKCVEGYCEEVFE